MQDFSRIKSESSLSKMALGESSRNGGSSRAVKDAAARIEKAKLQKGRGKRREKERSIFDKPTGGGFKYKSFNERLSAVKLDRIGGQRATAGLDPLSASGPPSKKRRIGEKVDAMDEDEEASSSLYKTRFGDALQIWRELNMSLPFIDFTQQASPLASSLPLLIHHRDELVELILTKLLRPAVGNESASLQTEAGSSTAQAGQYHAYAPAFDLIPRIALDLGAGAEFAPVFPRLLRAVLYIAAECSNDKGARWTQGDPVAASDIVEQAFSCATAMVKILSSWMLQEKRDSAEGTLAKKMRVQTWEIFRTYLGWMDPAEHGSKMEVKEEEEGDIESEDEGEAAEEEEQVELAVEGTQLAATTSTKAPRKSKKISPLVRRFASEALAHLVRTAISSGSSSVRLAEELGATMLQDLASMLEQQRLAEVHAAETAEKEEGVAAKKTAEAAEKIRTQAMSFAIGVAGIWAEACKVSCSTEKRELQVAC